MNIFYLHHRPLLAAQMHCDQHVVKMVSEYAQLLSTAHRLLDGKQNSISLELSFGKVKTRKVFLMPSEKARLVETVVEDKPIAQLVIDNKVCCMHTHENHPSNVWARSSSSNYAWLYELYQELSEEFEHRREKPHAAWTNWQEFLKTPPKNITKAPFQEPPQAMPEDTMGPDVVEAYRSFYNKAKSRFATWSRRSPPWWYEPKPLPFNAAEV